MRFIMAGTATRPGVVDESVASKATDSVSVGVLRATRENQRHEEKYAIKPQEEEAPEVKT